MLKPTLTSPWSTLRVLTAGVGAGATLAVLAFVLAKELASPRPQGEAALALSRIQAPVTSLTTRQSGAVLSEKTSLVTPSTEFERRWQASAAGPRTPQNEREMAALLEELAVQDPTRAMRLALGENNVRLRQILRAAVLRGWASHSVDEAAAWALALPEGEWQLSLASVFSGAVRHPESAVRLAARLCAEDPEQSGEYGQGLLSALTEAGDYELAAHFARTQVSASQNAWVHSVFFAWAEHQPEQASRAFGAIADSAVRDAAFKGLILGWAMAEPSTLVAYAMHLPPGENRATALSQALPQWVGRDTLVASEWINQLEPSADLDTGIASVATLANLVKQRPEIAVGWAESITEPVLRANTLKTVAEQWAQRDPKGLRSFLMATPELRPGDRASLADGLQPPPDGG